MVNEGYRLGYRHGLAGEVADNPYEFNSPNYWGYIRGFAEGREKSTEKTPDTDDSVNGGYQYNLGFEHGYEGKKYDNPFLVTDMVNYMLYNTGFKHGRAKREKEMGVPSDEFWTKEMTNSIIMLILVSVGAIIFIVLFFKIGIPAITKLKGLIKK